MHDLAIEELRVLAGKEDERGRNLARLAHPTDPRLLSVALHLISRAGSGLERGVDWAGGDGVHTDTLGHQLLGQSTSEAGDGTLGRGIVNHACGAAESHGRCGVDDATTLGDMLHRR